MLCAHQRPGSHKTHTCEEEEFLHLYIKLTIKFGGTVFKDVKMIGEGEKQQSPKLFHRGTSRPIRKDIR